MKKTKLTRSLLAACSIVALTAVLSGCLHDGDSDTVTDDMDMMDTPPPTPVAVTLPSLPTGAMYALSAGTHRIAAGGTATNGGVSFMCAAGGEACMVTVAADGTATATGGTVTASLTAAAKTAYDKQKMDAMTEDDGRAAGLYEALTRSDGANDIFTGGPSGAPLTVTPVRIPEAGFAPNTNTDIVITRELTGGLSVTRDRATWHAPATDAASPGATGWAGKVLTNGATQRITVYSNIEKAVRSDFEADTTTSIYRPGLTAGANPASNIPHLQGASTDSDGNTPAGPGPLGLSLTAADMRDAAAQGLLDPDYFPGPGETGTRTLTYTYNTSQTPGPRNYAASFAGIFHGASGTYACTTAPTTACTIAVTPASLTRPATYTAVGGWTFTPDREADDKNDAQLHALDSDWLSFGWWINEPEDAAPGGAYLYNAQVFYGGANVYDNGATNSRLIALPRLNLTYEGPAGGLYARQANETTGVTSARGEFSADATLTARFGLSTTAGTNSDVSGTIDNFANGDGVDMSGWELNLQRTAVVDANSGTTPGTGGSVTSGDAGNRAGLWEYTLYGPDRPGEYPTGIAGRFFANVDANTAVAGAFGAEKQ